MVPEPIYIGAGVVKLAKAGCSQHPEFPLMRVRIPPPAPC